MKTFRIGFNFAANVLPTSPPGSASLPLYTGLTANYAGLYQINFVVPSPPAGLPACASDWAAQCENSTLGAFVR